MNSYRQPRPRSTVADRLLNSPPPGLAGWLFQFRLTRSRPVEEPCFVNETAGFASVSVILPGDAGLFV